MSIVLNESNLYEELDGYRSLCLRAALYGTPKQRRAQRPWELLNQFGLTEAGLQDNRKQYWKNFAAIKEEY